MAEETLRDAMKVAYFCRPQLRSKLRQVKIAIGEERFNRALGLLEKHQIIEYPAVYPQISAEFPRGMPYPSVNYFLISFIYYPAWIHSYSSHLYELKKLINILKITKQVIETVRESISEIHHEYRNALKEQLNMISKWDEQDKKVIEELLDPTYYGKIKFSKSTRYWTS